MGYAYVATGAIMMIAGILTGKDTPTIVGCIIGSAGVILVHLARIEKAKS